MKKYLFTLILLAVGITTVTAQSETTSFDVDGIKVIFKPTLKNIINVRLYFRAGVSNYPSSQAGIESFAIEATTQCGTKKYPGSTFQDIADKYSILIDGSSEQDYGFTEFNCAYKFFNQAWDMFTDAIMNPTFEDSEVQLLRNKLIGRIRSAQSSPDSRIDQLAMKNAFGGTAYATDPDGSEGTLAALNPDDLKNYYQSILNKNEIFLVVVGKIDKDELIKKVKASFASVPVRPYSPVTYDQPVYNDNKLLIEKRPLATNYIKAVMNAPQFTSDDFVPFRIGMSAFGSVLFRELRTRLHLSYDPSADVSLLQMPYAEMSVSTTDPREAVQQMTVLLRKVKGITLSEDGLKEMKNGYITSNYIKQQSSAAIAANLGKAEILGGWKYEDNFATLIEHVTPQQIRDAFNKYIVGLRWTYLGNAAPAEQANEAFKQPLN